MTDVWKSTKKWTCKYCDITINDDAPSRNQHENGFRHIGNKERALRAIYKAGEQKKKAADQERREIEKIEAAAAIAHARDTGAPPPPPRPSSSAKPSAAAGGKPSSSGYTTAADLGFKDDPVAPGRDETIGQAGEWEVVAPPPPPSPSTDPSTDPSSLDGHSSRPVRRREEEEEEDDEPRNFKFKRKERVADFGGGSDEDLPAIKLKTSSSTKAPGIKKEVKSEVDAGPPSVKPVGEECPGGAEEGDVKPAVKEKDSTDGVPPTAGDGLAGGMFKKRRGPPKGLGKRPKV